ncbi:hypothetical protein NESM_000033900 [Novymonas esmeraldas]|uniref:Uncharacterized protein n=1 Tax=Novymonas esmeraldas TaxID=1808958 RepID=A0AAW0F155_9TRYP
MTTSTPVAPLRWLSAPPQLAARGIAASAGSAAGVASMCVSRRCAHTTTTTTTTTAPSKTTNEQLDELMDSFAEARALITDAMESVGTTYFADDMEDAETQTKDVLTRWEALQADLEGSGETEQLQRVRSMYELKIKQLKAELETVQEAGGSG